MLKAAMKLTMKYSNSFRHPPLLLPFVHITVVVLLAVGVAFSGVEPKLPASSLGRRLLQDMALQLRGRARLLQHHLGLQLRIKVQGGLERGRRRSGCGGGGGGVGELLKGDVWRQEGKWDL